MKLEKAFFLIVFGALTGTLIVVPSYPASIALFITACLYLMINEDSSDLDQVVMGHAQIIEELKMKVSQLSLATGLKKRD